MIAIPNGQDAPSGKPLTPCTNTEGHIFEPDYDAPLPREYRTPEAQEELTGGFEYVVHSCKHCPQWFVHFLAR